MWKASGGRNWVVSCGGMSWLKRMPNISPSKVHSVCFVSNALKPTITSHFSLVTLLSSGNCDRVTKIVKFCGSSKNEHLGRHTWPITRNLIFHHFEQGNSCFERQFLWHRTCWRIFKVAYSDMKYSTKHKHKITAGFKFQVKPLVSWTFHCGWQFGFK